MVSYNKGRYWCGLCGKWINEKDLDRDKLGNLICPEPSCRKRVRGTPRNAKYTKRKKLDRLEAERE